MLTFLFSQRIVMKLRKADATVYRNVLLEPFSQIFKYRLVTETELTALFIDPKRKAPSSWSQSLHAECCSEELFDLGD